MPKRKARCRSSAETSKESTPLRGADSDEDTPPKTQRKRLKRAPKSSAELCEEFGMNDVDLEYTSADYQNLTTFSLFMRMVRPQIVAANAKVAASKMSPVLEAKWREFNESNPYNREKDASEDEAKSATEEEKESSDSGSDTSSPVEVRPKKITSLKIRLPMVAVRKSLREKKPVQKLEEEEEDEDIDMSSGDDSIQNTTQRRGGRKRADDSDDEAFEVYSDSETDVRRIRKRKTTKKPKQRTYRKEESSSSEADTEEEDDSSDYSEELMPKKRKPVIPGERKSERERSRCDKSQMSDKEFERIMRMEERERIRKKERAGAERRKKEKKVREKRKEQKKKVEQLGADAVWEVTGGDGNDSDHSFYCVICKDGGDLLLCDTCPRSFHKKCLKLEELPEGDWSCPICQGQQLPEGESEDENHDQQCRVCKETGEMILCDFCPCVYHLQCLNPPLTTVPDGDWKCPRCVILENPLKGRVFKILTWRWSHKPTDSDELDHTCSPRKKVPPERPENKGNRQKESEKGKPERLLFVKYEFHSFWDCDWITEQQLEVHQNFTFRIFKLRWDQDEPPALEDGSNLEKTHHRSKSSPDDSHNLEERYYKYGIKPEWLTIHRILFHEGKKDKDMRYLVKWKGISYEEATWEAENEISDELHPEWKKHIKAYWARLKGIVKGKKEEKKKPKKSELKVRLKTQPPCIEKTGGSLHPYQLEGLNWLRFSWAQGTNTILADEMGLGKTIQTIAFLSVLYNEGHCPGPFLICAPLSTVSNWEREFEFWGPDLYVVTYTGGKKNRAIIRERDFSYNENAFATLARPAKLRPGSKLKFDVLLTSYELVSHDSTALQSIDWAVLVIDEAHKLKNNQSLFFRVLVDYKINYKLLLTGTPLQNTLEELFNLLNFMDREKFKEVSAFLDEFAEISKDEQVSKLHEMLAPHMLRRLKADVLKDIPMKTELILRVELAAMQKKFYKHILTKNYAALNVRGSANQTSLANIMMDLRKCANHPYLFPSAERDAPLTRKGLYEGSALVKACGKLELLEKMLLVLKRDGHRVLIFSQMTRMLDILEDFLEHFNFKFERIDGNIMGDKRQDRIDSFNDTNSESFVFLLSTKAGGLGINLATADTVIIYDMDWNPHNDIQALSRAHRIGQRNKVLIYRFVSKNTVEEKIVQVNKRKMMLTELVIHKGMGSAEKKDSLTKQEVNEILKFGAENLFKDDEEGRVVYDDAAVEKLLCREQVGEVEKDFGMNEYLCSFKVASYQVKDTAEEEQEEAIEEREEQEKKEEETHYWERVLGDSYALHLGQLQREQEEIAKSLGKGKRIRKQINYAETMQDGMLKSIKKRGDEKEEKEEPEERVYDSDMETKYLSDYEPNSSDSEEDDEEDFVAEGDKPTTTKPQVKTKTPPVEMPPLLAKYKGNIEEHFEALACHNNATKETSWFTNPQVLGFTARQRRSFLDTVMRFGMPPENVLKSQWMVRDLTKIAENAFKAYVSLFMRHLCEPISDNAQHFADGVPREGLSRQHVLTRIGMIALIRRKVHEFESVNHIISMNEFGTHPTEGKMKVGTDAAQYGKDSTKDGEKEGAEKDGENDDVVLLDSTKEDPKKDGKKEDKKDGESDDVVLLDSTKEEDKKDGEKEEDKKDGEKEEGKKDGESDDVVLLDDTSGGSSQECPVTMTSEAEDKGKEDGKTKIVKDGEKDTAEVKKGSDEAMTGRAEESGQKGKRKEEEMEIEEDSKEEQEKIEPADVQKSSSEESRNEKVEEMETEPSVESKGGTDGEKGENKVSDVEEDEEKTADMTVDEVEKEEKAPSEKDITKTTSEKDKAKIASEKDETEKDVEMDKKDKDAENETQGETEKEKSDKGDKTEVEPEDIGKSKDAADAEKTANKEKDIVEKEAEEEKQSAEKDADQQVEEKSEKADDGEVCDKKIEGTDEKTPEKAAEGEELVKTKYIIKKKEETDKDTEEINGNKTEAVRPKTLEEIMLELRRRFWIADGGFTDLHRLWVTEERGLVPGHEHEIWHRLHDYWLLAGIVTHGYRHWQDILGDPRFTILNHAFQSEGDKMRKAAFLNRRFQLIEQALVIEEQLRKALHESKLRQDSKKKLDSEDDGLSELDNLAANLRRLNQGQPPLGSMSEKKLHNVLNTVSALVSDIKAMSYTSMPATLSKGLPPPVPTVPPMARMPMVGGVVVPVATQQPPLQQMSIPAPPALTVKPRPTTAEESGVKDVICID